MYCVSKIMYEFTNKFSLGPFVKCREAKCISSGAPVLLGGLGGVGALEVSLLAQAHLPPAHAHTDQGEALL